jgi:hypothetical protein
VTVRTEIGLFSYKATFDKGLVVVRANNTSGKSTVVQAIIYALGLEHMLSASSVAPLHYALTSSLKFGGKEYRVLESDVRLEMENGSNEVRTVRRSIVSGSRQGRLITVTLGAALTNPEERYEEQDFFVRMEGAAQRELGFHRWLADWLGWTLPEVARFDGTECPLYVEAIFPIFIVEQKQGWTGIQTRLPTHFRIRELGKRVIEFVLSMDIENSFAARTAIRQQISVAEDRWKDALLRARQALRSEGAVIQGVPSTPLASWNAGAESTPLIFDGGSWKNISVALSEAETKLQSFQNVDVPNVESQATALESTLTAKQQALLELELIISRLTRDLDLEEAQQQQVMDRLLSLRTDRKHFQDLRRLQTLGSDFATDVSRHQCPTCSQPIADTLLAQVDAQVPMSLEENITFLEGQISTFENIFKDGDRVLEAKRSKVAAVQGTARQVRAEIRAAKESLVSSGAGPSAYDIRERMIAEDRVTGLRNAEKVISSLRAC